MSSDLTVAAVAEALGTSAQTVRTLLRTGDLRGHKVAWGSRYVWAVSQEALDDFIAEYGRLDGRRRTVRVAPQEIADDETPTATAEISQPPPTPEVVTPTPEAVTATPEMAVPDGEMAEIMDAQEPQPHRRPFVLRPRGRATVVVVVIGLPLLFAYTAALLVPGALWFDEVGQHDVFTTLVTERAHLYLRVAALAALVVAVNLILALGAARVRRSKHMVLGVVAASLVVGSLFAAAADGHWETFVLWQHRQPFGVGDPVHGKDVGYFVFTLPFYVLLAKLLLWLLAATAVIVAGVYLVRGSLGFRPVRARFEVQLHLGCIAALALLVVAWRLRLAQYLMALDQPAPGDTHAFAGAGYVDVNVRSPLLTGLTVGAVALAVGCVVLPILGRGRYRRPTRTTVGVLTATSALVIGVVGGVAPALVQRYVVDPNPLLSEQPYLARAIAATRSGMGLDAVDVQPYNPTGTFTASDFPAVEARLERVPAWDAYILGARMRQLVSEPPYYRPAEPVLDVVKEHGRPQLTAVSARELDLSRVADGGDSWSNERLSYTHGLGVVRFSSTNIEPSRQPRLLDAGLQTPEPRIYFGDLPAAAPDPHAPETEAPLITPTLDERVAQSPWVIANTLRPEVDVPSSGPTQRDPYHYNGTGGIELSSWVRRAVFALTLGSKEILLSDDIVEDSRLLLHRDVHDRLETLAPFITWDSEAVPLTADGGLRYVVHGYTTSANYPYGERVQLGDSKVNYARASVLATVDAFDGDVHLYATEPTDPILRAWRATLPSLFENADAIPAELEGRLRYPADLFDAQGQAYERFHTTDPDVFASSSDVWARPLALSGPIEVAGDIDFDEDDEDDLRLTMPPVYFYAPPPGRSDPAIVLATYYAPGGSGQNLVAALNGWVDDDGSVKLAARTLPRDPVTLGPAQVSRLVFASPRVRNLLGLRNLEIRDLDKSSIDAVLLGRPRILFLPTGPVQIQNLYEGSRGAGAARLLGVTAYVNGRAGLGRTAADAVRQALNEPPRIDVLPPPTAVVDEPTALSFHVENARSEVITVRAPDGRTRMTREVRNGLATVRWTPSSVGPTVMRVRVHGLDGTIVFGQVRFQVLATPPTIRWIDPPRKATAGETLRVAFKVANADDEVVTVSTSDGIVFNRAYQIRDGRGFVRWTPARAGPALMQIRVRGDQGQTVTRKLRIDVGPRESQVPPTVSLLRVPPSPAVGRSSGFAFRATDCSEATALITGPDGLRQTWNFACPASRARFDWTPTVPGRYTFTAIARGEKSSSQASVVLQVRGER